MDKRFLTAFIAPKRVTVAGFELRAFCIRHMLILHAIKSPYITQDHVPDCVETIQFLRLCSSDKPSVENLKPGFLDSLFAAKLHTNHQYHLRLIKCIYEYMEEYCSTPRTVVKEKMKSVSKNNIMDVPELLTLITFCMSKLGMSEDEALDMPFGRVAWYGTSYAIMEGADIRLISTELEEKAEEDKASILDHEAKMRERLLKAMKDGRIPKKNVRTNSK